MIALFGQAQAKPCPSCAHHTRALAASIPYLAQLLLGSPRCCNARLDTLKEGDL